MKVEVTTEVNHRYNNDYPCVLVQFEPEKDKHYFPDKHNWLPKFHEIFAILELLSVVDKEFARLLKEKVTSISYGKK